MVRQYIGARYVPKFYENSDGTPAWRSGVIYEPLTIVTYNWAATGIFNEQLTEVMNEVNALSDRVTEDESTLARLVAGRQFIFIGDSYGTGEGAEGPVVSYIDRCVTALGLVENITYWKNAIGGASFKGWNNRRSYRSLLEEVTPTDDAYITDIIVAGGINDATTGADLASNIAAMEDFVTYAHGRFANARLHICFLGWTTSVSTNLNMVNVSLPA